MKKAASSLVTGHSVTGHCGAKAPPVYAVICVMDFPLQAVLRADPTLMTSGQAGTAARPPTNTPGGRVAVPASFDADAVTLPNKTHTDGGPASQRAAFDSAATVAINGAAANLPRGTGSARPPASALPVGLELACAEERAPVVSSSHAIEADTAVRPPGEALAFAIVSAEAKKSFILHANAAARAEGVDAGMTAPQAQARCGRLVFRQRSPSAEADAQSLLLTCALTVAPVVEDSAPGLCTIDVRGLAPDDRSRAVAHAICELRALGLSATAGIAATPLLARYAARETTSVRTVENAQAFLHPLPLAIAEPTPELADILRNWGITTIGQFTALPKQEVIRRLGSEGLALWERARGGETRPLTLYVPSQQFSASLDLEYEIETTEGVLFILRRFVDRLGLELRASGFVAAEIALGLKLAAETRYDRSFRLPEPTAKEDILFRTLYSHLESLRTDSCVVGVSLYVVPVRPLVRQPGLFETGLRDPHGFSETLSRVTAVVGTGQLGTPQMEDTHRPDAVKLVAPEPVVAAMDQPSIWPPCGLPLRRFRPPVSAHVELTRNGLPAFVSGPQLHSPVAAARGPWRSSGDWWKPETWAREEWDIELAVGGLYRLAKVANEWYLDGEYE